MRNKCGGVEKNVSSKQKKHWTASRKHTKRQLKKLLNENLLSLPGPRKLRNREPSFEPAMKPECFFICGSSYSAQQIRGKLTKFGDFSCALQILRLGIPDKNTLYETYLYMSWAICQTPIWRWSHNLRDPKAHRRRQKFCIFTYCWWFFLPPKSG